MFRKLIGYGHIASQHAETVQKFHTTHLNSYLNFRRPRRPRHGKPGRARKTSTHLSDQDYTTPYEKVKLLSEAAKTMGRAKAVMLPLCKSESPFAPKCS